MTATSDEREIGRLTGEISLYLCEYMWSGLGSLEFGGQEFQVADSDDYRNLGYADDDNEVVLLRRESDGAYFEADIEVMVRRILPKAAEGEQIAGQLSIDRWRHDRADHRCCHRDARISPRAVGPSSDHLRHRGLPQLLPGQLELRLGVAGGRGQPLGN
jgi:hypothetical protein